MSRNVAVLMGGWSAERAVSLVSGDAVARALVEAGYSATAHDIGRDVAALLARLTPRPDVIFNALHGRWGEDGCLQGVLEILGIPYTHSGVLASALAMNKPVAKRLFQDAGIRCAEHVIVHRDCVLARDVMARPYVIKPLNEGSSVGVHIVREDDDTPALDTASWRFGDQVMVERYIAGREIAVAVMGSGRLA